MTYRLYYACTDYEHYYGDGKYPSKTKGVETFEAVDDDAARRKIPGIIKELLEGLYTVTPLKLEKTERGLVIEISLR